MSGDPLASVAASLASLELALQQQLAAPPPAAAPQLADVERRLQTILALVARSRRAAAAVPLPDLASEPELAAAARAFEKSGSAGEPSPRDLGLLGAAAGELCAPDLVARLEACLSRWLGAVRALHEAADRRDSHDEAAAAAAVAATGDAPSAALASLVLADELAWWASLEAAVAHVQAHLVSPACRLTLACLREAKRRFAISAFESESSVRSLSERVAAVMAGAGANGLPVAAMRAAPTAALLARTVAAAAEHLRRAAGGQGRVDALRAHRLLWALGREAAEAGARLLAGMCEAAAAAPLPSPPLSMLSLSGAPATLLSLPLDAAAAVSDAWSLVESAWRAGAEACHAAICAASARQVRPAALTAGRTTAVSAPVSAPPPLPLNPLPALLSGRVRVALEFRLRHIAFVDLLDSLARQRSEVDSDKGDIGGAGGRCSSGARASASAAAASAAARLLGAVRRVRADLDEAWLAAAATAGDPLDLLDAAPGAGRQRWVRAVRVYSDEVDRLEQLVAKAVGVAMGEVLGVSESGSVVGLTGAGTAVPEERWAAVEALMRRLQPWAAIARIASVLLPFQHTFLAASAALLSGVIAEAEGGFRPESTTEMRLGAGSDTGMGAALLPPAAARLGWLLALRGRCDTAALRLPALLCIEPRTATLDPLAWRHSELARAHGLPPLIDRALVLTDAQREAEAWLARADALVAFARAVPATGSTLLLPALAQPASEAVNQPRPATDAEAALVRAQLVIKQAPFSVRAVRGRTGAEALAAVLGEAAAETPAAPAALIIRLAPQPGLEDNSSPTFAVLSVSLGPLLLRMTTELRLLQELGPTATSGDGRLLLRVPAPLRLLAASTDRVQPLAAVAREALLAVARAQSASELSGALFAALLEDGDAADTQTSLPAAPAAAAAAAVADLLLARERGGAQSALALACGRHSPLHWLSDGAAETLAAASRAAALYEAQASRLAAGASQLVRALRGLGAAETEFSTAAVGAALAQVGVALTALRATAPGTAGGACFAADGLVQMQALSMRACTRVLRRRLRMRLQELVAGDGGANASRLRLCLALRLLVRDGRVALDPPLAEARTRLLADVDAVVAVATLAVMPGAAGGGSFGAALLLEGSGASPHGAIEAADCQAIASASQAAAAHVDASLARCEALAERWRPFEAFWRVSPAAVAARVASTAAKAAGARAHVPVRLLLCAWIEALRETLALRDAADARAVEAGGRHGEQLGCVRADEGDLAAAAAHRLDAWLADLLEVGLAPALAAETGRQRQAVRAAMASLQALRLDREGLVPSLPRLRALLVDAFGSLGAAAAYFTTESRSDAMPQSDDAFEAGASVSADADAGVDDGGGMAAQASLLRRGERLLMRARRDGGLPPGWECADVGGGWAALDSEASLLFSALSQACSALVARASEGLPQRQLAVAETELGGQLQAALRRWQEEQPVCAFAPGAPPAFAAFLAPPAALRACAVAAAQAAELGGRLREHFAAATAFNELLSTFGPRDFASRGACAPPTTALQVQQQAQAREASSAALVQAVERVAGLWRFLQTPWEAAAALRATRWHAAEPHSARAALDGLSAQLAAAPPEVAAFEAAHGALAALARGWRAQAPLLAELRAPAVQARHLSAVAALLGLAPDSFAEAPAAYGPSVPPRSSVTLGDVLDCDLAAHERGLRLVLRQSQGELGIDEFLRELAAYWEAALWDTAPHARGGGRTRVVRRWDALLAAVEDHLAALASMRLSPFFAPFAAQAAAWDGRLQLLRRVLDAWVDAQRLWLYLDGLFAASPDMREQLPQEAQRFSNADAELAQCVALLAHAPQVLAAPCLSVGGAASGDAGGSGAGGGAFSLVPPHVRAGARANALLSAAPGNLASRLLALCDSLARVQAGLSDYLERRRAAFARFYFFGDEDLLGLLGSARDPAAVERYLPAMFAGIAALEVHEQAPAEAAAAGLGLSPLLLLHAVGSAEGEVVTLAGPPIALQRRDGSAALPLHEWLEAAAAGTGAALAATAARAAFALQSDLDLFRGGGSGTCGASTLVGLLSSALPCEGVVLGAWVFWTRAVEHALKSRATEMLPLRGVAAFLAAQLQAFAAAAATADAAELSATQRHLQRRKREQGVVDLVHKRDVTAALLAAAGGPRGLSASDFEWRCRLRAYAGEASGAAPNASGAGGALAITVAMAGLRVAHGLEYHGVGERLVQTPLTDRCFLALTHALHMRLGGSPFGPAGTGKTETVKALGAALGRLVLVFNCDDSFDFRAMGRIFSGLCRAGCWGCFDEFNRLEAAVLSAISQQLQAIQQGLARAAGAVELLGRRTPLHRDVAVFITMNPGYAGRSQLPDNLKALFRPVAMVRPDTRMITAVLLFTQGFGDADALSARIAALFTACDSALSPQPHYDFGLRALKTVLVQAGASKRRFVERGGGGAGKAAVGAERRLLARCVADSVLPKLVPADVAPFSRLLAREFPPEAVVQADAAEGPPSADSLLACAAAVASAHRRLSWRAGANGGSSEPPEGLAPGCFPCVALADDELSAVAGGMPLADERLCPRLALSSAGAVGASNTRTAAAGFAAAAAGNAWFAKVLQLHQLQAARHGVMLLGRAGSGKSAAWRVLLDAMTLVDGVRCEATVIDVKALAGGRGAGAAAKEQLYGRLDAATGEWRDGLLTATLRLVLGNARGEAGRRHWLVLDGDVDPEWAESLNSVLDDTRQLTLPSGERLAVPPNVRLLFEVDSLRHATLATVSRCGMVCFGDDCVAPAMLARRFVDVLLAARATRDEGDDGEAGDDGGARSLAAPHMLLAFAREREALMTDTVPAPASAPTTRQRLLVAIGRSLERDLCHSGGVALRCIAASLGAGPGLGPTATVTPASPPVGATARGAAVPTLAAPPPVPTSTAAHAAVPAPIMALSGVALMRSLLALVRRGLSRLLEGLVLAGDSEIDGDMDMAAQALRMRQWALLSVCWAVGAPFAPPARRAIAELAAAVSLEGGAALCLPAGLGAQGPSLVDFALDLTAAGAAEWRPWAAAMPRLDLGPDALLDASLVVPTADTLRHSAMLSCWLAARRPVLLCGPPGSGKTMLLNAVLASGAGDAHVAWLSFSSSTTPEYVLRTLEQFCEYVRSAEGWALQPLPLSQAGGGGRDPPARLVVFCDEVNLPALDRYGTQRVVALLRQLVEAGGFWAPMRLEGQAPTQHGASGPHTQPLPQQGPPGTEPAWVTLRRVQFVGACNPPTDAGRVALPPRFLRHAPVICVGYPSPEGLRAIYGALSGGLCRLHQALAPLASPLAAACLDAFAANQARFAPANGAPAEPQCIYSPRELSRWMRALNEGLLPLARIANEAAAAGTLQQASASATSAARLGTQLVRLWLHEGLRLFSDRLSRATDRAWVAEQLDATAAHHLGAGSGMQVDLAAALARPVLFSDWITGSYQSVSADEATAFAQSKARAYSEAAGAGAGAGSAASPLVVFDDALAHIMRIDRVLQQPLGHLLLAGPSGAGKCALTRLACWLRGTAVVAVRLSRRYAVADFDRDLRLAMLRSGAHCEPIALLFDEGGVQQLAAPTAFLERMNALLASGEVPGLFEGDERRALLAACRDAWAGGGVGAGAAVTGSGSAAAAAAAVAAAARLRAADLDSDDAVLRLFTRNVQRHLHVVFTSDPAAAAATVGPGARGGVRASQTQSPALFNRCVVDYFGDWSATARVQMACATTLALGLRHGLAPGSFLDAWGSKGAGPPFAVPHTLLLRGEEEGGRAAERAEAARAALSTAAAARLRAAALAAAPRRIAEPSGAPGGDGATYSDAIAALLSALHAAAADVVQSCVLRSAASAAGAALPSPVPFVSPRDYSEMLRHFGRLYRERRSALGRRQAHVGRGLARMQATAAAVAAQRAEQAATRLFLARKNDAAGAKLEQMVRDQHEAERRRHDGLQLRARLATTTAEVQRREAAVAAELAQAEPALAEAQASVGAIGRQQLDELRSLAQPPLPVRLCLEAVLTLLGQGGDDAAGAGAGAALAWPEVRRVIKGADFIGSVVRLRTEQLSARVRRAVQERYVDRFHGDAAGAGASARPQRGAAAVAAAASAPPGLSDFSFERINAASKACGPLYTWVMSQLAYAAILERVEPLRAEALALKAEKDALASQAEAVGAELAALEASILRYRGEYAALVREAELLRAELAAVEARVERAAALVASLAHERERWELATRSFEAAARSLAADCAVAAAFLAYGGWHDARGRAALEAAWRAEALRLGVPCRSRASSAGSDADDAENGGGSDVVDLLCDAGERARWQTAGLQADELGAGNALLLTRSLRFPFVIDPALSALRFIERVFAPATPLPAPTSFAAASPSKRGASAPSLVFTHAPGHPPLARASLLDPLHLRALEAACRFGTALLLTDAEHLDASLFSLLQAREAAGYGGADHDPWDDEGDGEGDRAGNVSRDGEARPPGAAAPAGRVIVRLGDADVDLSPSFRLVLLTRDATAQVGPGVAARVTLVNFSNVTAAGLRDAVLQRVLAVQAPAARRHQRRLLAQRAEADARLALLEARLLDELSSGDADAASILDDDRVLRSLEALTAEAAAMEARRDAAAAVLAGVQATARAFRPVAAAAKAAFFAAQQVPSRLGRNYRLSLAHFMAAVEAGLRAGRGEGAGGADVVDAEADRSPAAVARLVRSVLAGVFGATSRFMHAQHARAWALALLGILARADAGDAAALRRVETAEAELVPALVDVATRAQLGGSASSSSLLAALVEAGTANADTGGDEDDEGGSGSGAGASALPAPVVLLFCTSGADVDAAVAAAEAAGPPRPAPLRSIAMGASDSEQAATAALAAAARDGGWVLLRNAHLAAEWADAAVKRLGAASAAGAPAHPGFRAILTVEVPLLLPGDPAPAPPPLPAQLLLASSKAMLEAPAGLRAALLRAVAAAAPSLQRPLPQAALEPLRERAFLLLCWLHAVVVERRRYGGPDVGDADLACALATVDGLLQAPASAEGPALLREVSTLLAEAVHGARFERAADADAFGALLARALQPAALAAGHALSADAAFPAVTPAPGGGGEAAARLVRWAEAAVAADAPATVLGLAADAERGLAAAEGRDALAGAAALRGAGGE